MFLGPISRLAPGILPPVKIHEPTVGAGCSAIVGVACLVAGLILEVHSLSFVGAVLFLVSWGWGWLMTRTPIQVEFGKLRTFRDLAMLLAPYSRDCVE